MSRGLDVIPVNSQVTLYHTGPSLTLGPLPSFFYFALSGPDSLCLNPFNQPVQFLQETHVRIFSLTLPGHEDDLPAANAMHLWAEDLTKGFNCLENFIQSAQVALDFAIKEKFIDPARLAVGGLSRGGFIAAHLAAREEKIQHVLAFAPLTQLSKIREFAHLQDHPLISCFDLSHLSEKLSSKHLKLFIGNEDTRVSTSACFDFAMSLVKHKKGRSAQVELLIYPSVGQKGHGTPPEIFRQGVAWIQKLL